MRQIPFGYEIRDGERTVKETEAAVVRKIFTMYVNGASYNGIVETLRNGAIPYDEVVESWNKNNVARILAHGERYTGNEKWPKLLDGESAQRSAAAHEIKVRRINTKENSAQNIVWPLLRCPECGGRLLRASGRAAKRGALILRCCDCKYIVRTTGDELLANLRARLESDDEQAIPLPDFSAEILRRQNELTRASAANTPIGEFRERLFALLSAQYGAINCPRVPLKYVMDDEQNRSAEIEWLIFGRAVSAVCVSKTGEVQIQYTNPKTEIEEQESQIICQHKTRP